MTAKDKGLSVLILTLNEEINLPVCLDSLNWCDDITILDSFSSDQTEELAKERGIRFIQRQFDNYASQRNFGLNHVSYKYDWLLMVDADEVVPIDLIDEILQRIQTDSASISLYRMRRKDHFLGKWIKHSSGYPTWFGRLMRVGSVWVERDINEEFVTSGEVGYLNNHLHHFPFNKGFSAWLDKHNRYSTMEAEFMFRGGLAQPTLNDFVSNDPAVRRKAIKGLIYRMPGRPILIFIALYVIKGGFLDGRAGLIFCLLRGIYEFMINCKIKEMRLRVKSLPL